MPDETSFTDAEIEEIRERLRELPPQPRHPDDDGSRRGFFPQCMSAEFQATRRSR